MRRAEGRTDAGIGQQRARPLSATCSARPAGLSACLRLKFPGTKSTEMRGNAESTQQQTRLTRKPARDDFHIRGGSADIERLNIRPNWHLRKKTILHPFDQHGSAPLIFLHLRTGFIENCRLCIGNIYQQRKIGLTAELGANCTGSKNLTNQGTLPIYLNFLTRLAGGSESGGWPGRAAPETADSLPALWAEA